MDYLTTPLGKLHKKESFSCGHFSLDRYLKEQASQDMKRKLAICFVLAESDNVVRGYYTLSNGAISKSQVPEEIQKRIGYQDIPVTLIGRMAIDIKFQKQGLGGLLLMDALRRGHEAAQRSSGSFAVITDPIDFSAEKFYLKYGFKKLEGNDRMFLMMKSLDDLW